MSRRPPVCFFICAVCSVLCAVCCAAGELVVKASASVRCSSVHAERCDKKPSRQGDWRTHGAWIVTEADRRRRFGHSSAASVLCPRRRMRTQGWVCSARSLLEPAAMRACACTLCSTAGGGQCVTRGIGVLTPSAIAGARAIRAAARSCLLAPCPPVTLRCTVQSVSAASRADLRVSDVVSDTMCAG